MTSKRRLRIGAGLAAVAMLTLAGCGPDGGAGGPVTAAKETLISHADLAARYNWDGDETLWKWDAAVLSGAVVNGNVWALENSATERDAGLPFSFGSGAHLFGRTCLGDLALDGAATLAEDGLLLHAETVMNFTGSGTPNPCAGAEAAPVSP